MHTHPSSTLHNPVSLIFYLFISRFQGNLYRGPETKLPSKTELNPKSEVTFLIRTQQFSLSDLLSPQFGLSDSLSES